MRRLTNLCGILLLTWICAPLQAATILVTTAADEANCNTTDASTPTPACDKSADPASYPLSTGCSLREAIQDIRDVDTGALHLSFPECVTPDAGDNTIDISGAGAISLGTPVPDPGDSTGVNMVSNSTISVPSVGAFPTVGKIIILGPGSIGCDATNGIKMFVEADDADFTLSGLSMGPCSASGGGIGITNNGGNLTINTVTFTAIVSTSGGSGGCISHSQGSNLGSLIIDNANFLGCIADDLSNPVGGPGVGQGGAIYSSSVQLPNLITLTDVTFTGNIAGDSGGAIYWANIDSLGHSMSIKNGVFTGNIARGTALERGGGAIYATTDLDSTDSFLIAGTQFIGNLAPNGQGGAIMLAGGQLAYLGNTLPLVLTGGILGSNFSGNIAGGAASGDFLGGSGGAIFAEGNLTVLQSSFVGNSSTHGSGGAIALRNQSTNLGATVIANTTFNSDTADQNGGGIANINVNGKLTLINDTIDSNTATGTSASGGGALYNANTTTSDVQVSNTILSNSSGAGGNCVGAITDTATNLQFPDATCGATMTSADPQLGSPTIHLGPNLFVLTQDLGATSPASGGGTQATCDAGPILDFDETGTPAVRPSGKPNCDIGAYETSELTPVRLQSFEVD